MLKWLFFDVGGTLIDEEPVYQYQERLILELLNKAGCNVPLKEFEGAVRAARRHYLPRHASHLIWIFTEDPERYESIFSQFEKALNRLSYKQYHELARPMPGMKEMLASLRGRYSMGLIGNQPAIVRQLLEDEGLLEYFPVQALSAEMGMRKPDLRFYLAALAMAGCPPDEAAMIGDRLDNDIFPARMLGMTTVRLKLGPHRHQPVLSPEYLPHYTASTPHELSNLLASDAFVSRAHGGELVW